MDCILEALLWRPFSFRTLLKGENFCCFNLRQEFVLQLNSRFNWNKNILEQNQWLFYNWSFMMIKTFKIKPLSFYFKFLMFHLDIFQIRQWGFKATLRHFYKRCQRHFKNYPTFVFAAHLVDLLLLKQILRTFKQVALTLFYTFFPFKCVLINKRLRNF